MATKLIHWFLSRFFLSGCSDYNPLEVRRACRSKAQARDAFEKNILPYAKGKTFIGLYSAFKFSDKYGFPLVIKPNVGGFSRGAYFPIENKVQLLKAGIGVKKWWPTSIIEQYLLGKNYRVVMTKFGIMSILRRYPPFVVGDGVQTIDTLINVENALRKKMQLMPITHLIPKNRAIKKHLKQQNMDFFTIPTDKQRVYLHHKISLKLGSSIEIVDKDTLTDNNKQDLIKVLNFFNANILGIDVICKQGIEVDFDAQQCIFLEVNSRPFLKMHDNPRYGEKPKNLNVFYNKLEQLEITDNEKY
ncbi:Glutamate--cysteine ligase [Bathymodiolus heckerae thiotrophic gill symbiont]|uniref:cyanophycin synthetase n=1 Tax=Bathymodiolus heckerae thiotrophic gill symbiont TaxID=1052212 RepID=UPI0010B4C47A|nr:cyanophycin synthetase [Bathymodiolus heckerae thiotrophic gill symbiont]SHN89909.1 Glutamate--cysteine ligase [Bathymodiolus heckerae thiotrophic gill symbiont]